MEEPLTFEKSLELKQISPDVFENVYHPWTWAHSGVVPGGVLMSMSAVAAHRTVPEDFVLANLQTHFLSGPKPQKPFVYRVNRLSSGRRFAHRTVTIEQSDKVMVTVTLSFVKGSAWTGPSMRHAVKRTATLNVEDITKDDLSVGRTRYGPWMKFQRLPLWPKDSDSPESKIAPAAARITPISAPAGTTAHTMGIINLSDYHVLDAPLSLSGITFGLPTVGSERERIAPGDRKATHNNVKMNTSLNHAIHFHVRDGFRADEVTYIEVTSPWARDGRAMLHSRIFAKDGTLIATCAQEGYYVLKDDAKSNIGVKL